MANKRRRFELALAPHALRARTSFLVDRLASPLRRQCTEQLRELRITMAHFAVLCSLEEFRKCCNSDLIRWTGIDGPRLIPILNSLQSRLCLGRDRDDADQRRAELKLWPDGQELRALAEHALEEAENEVFRALTLEERALLRELLLRAVDRGG